MKKPIILISQKPLEDPLGFGVGGFHSIRTNYCRAVIAAGGVPVISALGDAEAYAEYADGLLLTGGSQDVEPARYGDTVRYSEAIDPVLDDSEFQLFDRFLRRKKPILGVCRGIQLINVALGGTLYQDIAKEGPTLSVHTPVLEEKTTEHAVKAVEGTQFHKLFGDSFLVNSFHHQAIKDCAEGLIPSVVTEEGITEAVEHKELPIWAVQWHPERMIGDEYTNIENMIPLFKHFVSSCKA